MKLLSLFSINCAENSRNKTSQAGVEQPLFNIKIVSSFSFRPIYLRTNFCRVTLLTFVNLRSSFGAAFLPLRSREFCCECLLILCQARGSLRFGHRFHGLHGLIDEGDHCDIVNNENFSAFSFHKLQCFVKFSIIFFSQTSLSETSSSSVSLAAILMEIFRKLIFHSISMTEITNSLDIFSLLAFFFSQRHQLNGIVVRKSKANSEGISLLEIISISNLGLRECFSRFSDGSTLMRD